MIEPRDPLLDAIRAAGEVAPPPDRDAAFARAMQPVLMPSRRRLSRGFIALFAAASLAAPAAVLAAHESRTPPATTPIVSERPDPGTSIQREADDATVKREAELREAEHSTTSSADDHGGSITTTSSEDHSGSGSPSIGSGDSSGSGSGSGSDEGATVSPTPTSTESSSSSSGSTSDGGSVIDGSTDGGSSGSN